MTLKPRGSDLGINRALRWPPAPGASRGLATFLGDEDAELEIGKALHPRPSSQKQSPPRLQRHHLSTPRFSTDDIHLAAAPFL